MSDHAEDNVYFEVGNYRLAINMPRRAGLMAEVAARLARGEGFALATVNLDHLVKLRQSAEFREAYRAQDLVVADGNPLVWLSRLAGDPVELVPGADMVVPLAGLAARQGVPVALLGSTEAALAGAAEALSARVPGVKVAARIAPPMGFDPAGPGGDAVLREVEASGARLVFLALGAPKQEILAARGRVITPGLGFASIGAGLDFLAGAQQRAPRIMRRLALEWFWRMLSNPRRLVARYAQCAAILPAHAVRALRQRHTGVRERTP
jgi:N-acetylglucosaminyldiphosphoundecaprenol N-acetyl-beta-D-mannosaminyltransferase